MVFFEGALGFVEDVLLLVFVVFEISESFLSPFFSVELNFGAGDPSCMVLLPLDE